VETSDERVEDGADVERYEQLRRRALGGDAAGWRLGMAVLQRHGVAAWNRACQSTASLPPARPAAATPVADGVVGVLATMALACLRSG
jgi:hypothetical protein